MQYTIIFFRTWKYFTLYQNKFGLFRFISLPSNLSNTVKLNKSEIRRTTTTQFFLKTAILARGQKELPLPEVKLLSFTGHNSPSRRKVMTFNPKAWDKIKELELITNNMVEVEWLKKDSSFIYSIIAMLDIERNIPTAEIVIKTLLEICFLRNMAPEKQWQFTVITVNNKTENYSISMPKHKNHQAFCNKSSIVNYCYQAWASLSFLSQSETVWASLSQPVWASLSQSEPVWAKLT